MLLYHLNQAASSGAKNRAENGVPFLTSEELNEILKELQEESIKTEKAVDSSEA